MILPFWGIVSLLCCREAAEPTTTTPLKKIEKYQQKKRFQHGASHLTHVDVLTTTLTTSNKHVNIITSLVNFFITLSLLDLKS